MSKKSSKIITGFSLKTREGFKKWLQHKVSSTSPLFQYFENLYIKETGMAEEIQERIEQLKVSKDLIDEQYERDIQTALDIESEDELSNEEFNPEV